MDRDFYTSADEPLCPLCGVQIQVPADGTACTTLSELATHFARDCAAITVAPPASPPAPRH